MAAKNEATTYTVKAQDNDIIKKLADDLGTNANEVIIRGIQAMQLYAHLSKDPNKKLIIKDAQNNNEQELTL